MTQQRVDHISSLGRLSSEKTHRGRKTESGERLKNHTTAKNSAQTFTSRKKEREKEKEEEKAVCTATKPFPSNYSSTGARLDLPWQFYCNLSHYQDSNVVV